jgi:DNA-binding CsgD family transcriptional regulator
MTNKEKRLLRQLAKEGKSADEIADYVDCARSTILKYIRIFKPRRAT